jgi:drug/metabolite transporter (DMT)-like permease
VILKFKKTALPKSVNDWRHFAAMALSCAIPFSLFGVGEQYIDSSYAAILNGTTPLFTLLMAHFFIENDRLTKTKIIGSAIGFSGLFILVAPSLVGAKATFFGAFAILMAAACYGAGFVYAKKYIHGFKPLVVPTGQLLLATLFLLPFSLIFENPLEVEYASSAAIASVLALAVFGTSLAFVLYFKLIAETSATYASTVTYIVPIFGIILGMIFLDEKLTWNNYVASVMIIIGLMIANGTINISKPKIKKTPPISL